MITSCWVSVVARSYCLSPTNGGGDGRQADEKWANLLPKKWNKTKYSVDVGKKKKQRNFEQGNRQTKQQVRRTRIWHTGMIKPRSSCGDWSRNQVWTWQEEGHSRKWTEHKTIAGNIKLMQNNKSNSVGSENCIWYDQHSTTKPQRCY